MSMAGYLSACAVEAVKELISSHDGGGWYFNGWLSVSVCC